MSSNGPTAGVPLRKDNPKQKPLTQHGKALRNPANFRASIISYMTPGNRNKKALSNSCHVKPALILNPKPLDASTPGGRKLLCLKL